MEKESLGFSNIGLIGTGHMGYGIGLNLIKAGFNLNIVCHSNVKSTKELEKLGAKIRDTNKEIARNCDLLILCLPNSKIVEEVIIGKDGIVDCLRANTIVIDCTTAEPSSTLFIKKELNKKGIHFIDAPLTRSPKEAIEGRLNVMAGGDFNVFMDSLPVLKSFSENVFYVGDSASGNKMKLLNNFISMSFILTIINAIAYAKTENIDMHKLDEIMSKGSNYIPALPLMIKWLNSRDKSILEFSIENAFKDIQYFKNWINDKEVDSQLLDSILNIYQKANDSGFGTDTLPKLFDFLTYNKPDN